MLAGIHGIGQDDGDQVSDVHAARRSSTSFQSNLKIGGRLRLFLRE